MPCPASPTCAPLTSSRLSAAKGSRSFMATRCARCCRRRGRSRTGSRSWRAGTRLELDTYMADGGRYRRRRHAVFAAAAGFGHRAAAASASLSDARIQPAPRRRRPMVRADRAERRQRRDASDRPRVLPPAVRNARGPTAPRGESKSISSGSRRAAARPGARRRKACTATAWTTCWCCWSNRRNIASGTTSIHALDGRTLGQFTLTDPFDAALVDDSRVAHGVTPVEAIDAASRDSGRTRRCRSVGRPSAKAEFGSLKVRNSALYPGPAIDTVMYCRPLCRYVIGDPVCGAGM